ncbi:DUF378 domain-containing protein [Myxococcus qinghaiensis]|uniref:DUF378 domain-containing protein n=1 Tax=Myxococcus qinghaiensis TaxID=2906758 RepID=UPI0020A7131A|nr:DUF378 domain-containing protein [Myxococcus qinghaiensis]MCP3162910.1 DUF378 domain-containing protein [Myxococcus qinghaiensis]
MRSTLMKVTAVLAIIGAINWGLIGFFNWNLVNAIFGGSTQGQASALARLIYCIVGLAGLALALTFPWSRKETTTTTGSPMTGGRTISGRT